MIDRTEILGLATDLSLSADVVEKDYVIGWLLAGMYAHPDLAGTWIFKGGTCLKKCYFETYRFSEDLDFTLCDSEHVNSDFLQNAFGEVANWVYEKVGIEIPVAQVRFESYVNKRGGTNCEGRIYYNGPLQRAGALPRVKLDLTADEILVLEPVVRPVAHPYSDKPDEGMTARCYAYGELMGEKLRALGDRTRPRDLYDVVNLFRSDQYRPAASEVRNVLRQKCEFKNIGIPTLVTLTDGLEELTADWSAMLDHQLPSLPPFESFWSALPGVLAWLETGAVPIVPSVAPTVPGELVFRPMPGSLRREGVAGSSYLETIRFAAANRLCVDLSYGGGVRRIEPYSLRRTNDGNVLLFAIRSDSRESRSYRLDRIQGAKATNQTFTPSFAVELTPTESGSIPSIVRRSGSHSSSKARRTSGPVYVYQCYHCGKKFRRTRRDSRLNQHKTPYGGRCAGRSGSLINTIY